MAFGASPGCMWILASVLFVIMTIGSGCDASCTSVASAFRVPGPCLLPTFRDFRRIVSLSSMLLILCYAKLRNGMDISITLLSALCVGQMGGVAMVALRLFLCPPLERCLQCSLELFP